MSGFQSLAVYDVNTPQMSGKAQQAYAALPSDEAKEYDQLKDAIFRRYDIICINEETYRQRFRAAMKSSEESNRELAVRERKPICLEAGQLADDYAQARKQAGGDLRSEDSRKGGWGKQSSAVQEKGRGSEELSKDEDGKRQPYSKGPSIALFTVHAESN
eukprot:Em0024g361a